MSEVVGCTWPEQDAVWAWMERHGITLTMEQENDLKKSVTAPRVSEKEARERAEDRLSRLLDWITQGQMSECNYTYEAMHQAVESAFMEAVRQQEERAERAEQAERERDELWEALESLGSMPDGFCFCFNSIRDPLKPEHEHTGECQEACRALGQD